MSLIITTICLVPFPWTRFPHSAQRFHRITPRLPLLILYSERWIAIRNFSTPRYILIVVFENNEIPALWTHNLVILFERERVQRDSLFVTTKWTHLYLMQH